MEWPLCFSICLVFVSLPALSQKKDDGVLDQQLQKILHKAGFTGRVLFRHLAHDCSNEILTCLEKFIEGHRLIDHSLETTPVFRRDIEARRRQRFGHRPIMAEKIDYECFTHLVVYAFLGKQIPEIEQVTRMLAIERSYNLAAVQVRETDDQHFRSSAHFLSC